MRLASSDVPTNSPLRRRGRIKARRTAAVYQIDTGRGSEWAVWEGSTLLDLGADVTIEYDHTINAWWIAS